MLFAIHAAQINAQPTTPRNQHQPSHPSYSHPPPTSSPGTTTANPSYTPNTNTNTDTSTLSPPNHEEIELDTFPRPPTRARHNSMEAVIETAVEIPLRPGSAVMVAGHLSRSRSRVGDVNRGASGDLGNPFDDPSYVVGEGDDEGERRNPCIDPVKKDGEGEKRGRGRGAA
ncbi:hypothetical protein CC80DRAFT_488980 [Byssothecium circinans]|uniref:Uncharacterized protein n=1 Tax=Byssothecium circinans TaxID=147558 RepID=A0A6A5U6D0_9PLEO|nr:hypothetical protein CC80DRAFT_488980 [Byssothecium circinans]